MNLIYAFDIYSKYSFSEYLFEESILNKFHQLFGRERKDKKSNYYLYLNKEDMVICCFNCFIVVEVIVQQNNDSLKCSLFILLISLIENVRWKDLITRHLILFKRAE